MNPLKFYIFAYWHDQRWKKFVGATVKIWDLAHNLSVHGHDVVVFLPKFKFDKTKLPFQIVEIPFLNIHLVRSLSFNLLLLLYLALFCFKRRPDVVYVRRMGSIVPAVYVRLVNSIFFYEVNDDPYRKDYHEGSSLVFRIRAFISEWQDKINLQLCDRAFIITKEILKKILKKNPGLQAVKLVEMPSGANSDLFRPMPVRECRSRLNIDLEKKYIGFAGTLLKHQGIDILIDAAHSILVKEPSGTFIIIGEGPMKDIWMNKVEKQYLGEYFIFTGQIDYEDMPVWIGAMDICIAPFLDSTGLRSPVKIFDYMSCGKPVVASRIEGTTDVFSDSGAIKLVAPGNSEMLSSAVIELLKDQQKAYRMGENGREFILAKYDRKTIAQRIVDEAVSCKT